MLIELKEIKAVLERSYSCAVADFDELLQLAEDERIVFCDPLLFNVRLQRVGQLVELDGQLQATVRLQCGRCLVPFETLLSESFSLTFAPRKESAGEAEEVELEADELGLVYYTDELIELKRPLLEQLLMALPIGPLCSDDCRGLCLQCGADLNSGQCCCEAQVFNNKFAALAALKKDSDG